MSTRRMVASTAVTALLAHVPCCLPPLLIGLGGAATSGLSWLHALDPYRPWLIGLGLAQLAWGFWVAHQPVKSCACAAHAHHDYVVERRIKIGAMWVMAILVVGLALIPHVH